MAFTLLQDVVNSEAQFVPEEVLAQLPACIIGGNAFLLNYPEDKEQAFVGNYDRKALNSFAYPHKPANCETAAYSVRVFADEALLEYFSGSFTPVTGQPSHIYSTAGVPQLHGRSVQIGDFALISYNAPEGPCSLRAVIVGLISHPAVEGSSGLPSASGREIRTLVLSRNLPMAAREAESLEVALCVARNNVEIASSGLDGKPVVEIRTTELTVEPNLHILDTAWVVDGKPVAVPVREAKLYVQYKAWCSELTGKIHEIRRPEELVTIPGPDHPDNELKWAVKLALLNAGERPVKFIAVADPGVIKNWSTALSRAKDVYGLVPLSTNPAVLKLFVERVNARSQAETGKECVLWQSVNVPPTVAVAAEHNSQDGCELLAAITESTGSGFIADVVYGNAQFVTLGIRSGDILRYITDANGDYDEYVILTAINEDSLLIQGGQGLKACSEPKKIEVWRTLGTDELAHAVATMGANCNSKRIRAVWPDRVGNGHYIFPGYHLCAALAGLRSGCAPQQDLAGVEIRGITEVDRSLGLFDDMQLDMMSECGIWVVVDSDGIAVTRDALTTAEYGNLADSNEAIVSNLDSVNKILRSEIASLLHSAQTSTAIQHNIHGMVHGKLLGLTVPRIERLGPQIISAEVALPRRHVFIDNSVVLTLKLRVPVTQCHGLTVDSIEVQQKIVA